MSEREAPARIAVRVERAVDRLEPRDVQKLDVERFDGLSRFARSARELEPQALRPELEARDLRPRHAELEREAPVDTAAERGPVATVAVVRVRRARFRGQRVEPHIVVAERGEKDA